MVSVVSSTSAQHLSSSPRNQLDVQHLETYLVMVDQAIHATVEPNVRTAALTRALRSKVAYDAIDTFFQGRLREALRICSFMGPSVRNPVSTWLLNQDSRVLQRLLHTDTLLDASEVDRITNALNSQKAASRPMTVPSPVALAA